MTTLLPRDDDETPIQALGLRPGGAHTLAVGAASTRTQTAFAASTCVISVYATAPVHIRLGDGAVTAAATDHFLPADTLVDLSLGGGKRPTHTHLAAIRTGIDCTLYISERE